MGKMSPLISVNPVKILFCKRNRILKTQRALKLHSLNLYLLCQPDVIKRGTNLNLIDTSDYLKFRILIDRKVSAS